MTLNIFNWSYRQLSFLGVLICFGLVGFAIASESLWGLKPCPLCMFQRVAFIALGIIFLIAAIHAPKGRTGRVIYGLLELLPALAGVGVAAKHVWLTHLPADKVPACGPPLAFMMDSLPLMDVIRNVLSGSGDCAKVDWTFLGMSMPAWSLFWLILLTILAILTMLKRSNRAKEATRYIHSR